MVKVITYGTYDLMHHGHIRLLERAKALGDYLIVGVTSDTFDKSRGKINVQQSLTERIEAVRATGIADEIIIEEYEGQKIDDIKRYNVDIFTVGSDWIGKFDYLKEFCKVVYLERTKGISSSELRTEERKLSVGIVGNTVNVLEKFVRESTYVNGIEIKGVCTKITDEIPEELKKLEICTENFETLVKEVDALYLVTHPSEHYEQIKKALKMGKHILCEAPLSIKSEQCKELFDLAKENNCILMESIKTAYSLAFDRLILLVKSGAIGEVISVDAVCTSLEAYTKESIINEKKWGSMYSWGPYALLSVFSLLGTNYDRKIIQTRRLTDNYDLFTKIDLIYKNGVGTIKVGKGVKSEGDLVISGTKGYVYVPAPWWKMDYFEVRFENPQDNRRYFYQLDGEGIRYMIVSFLRSIQNGKSEGYVPSEITYKISEMMEEFDNRNDTFNI